MQTIYKDNETSAELEIGTLDARLTSDRSEVYNILRYASFHCENNAKHFKDIDAEMSEYWSDKAARHMKMISQL